MGDFFSLPIGGYGAKPNPWLKSESGRPMYETPLGVSFEIQPQPMQQDVYARSLADALAQGLQGNPFYGPAQAEMDVQRQGAEATLGGILPGLLQGVLQGVQAPGRAARGEPVTYGDVWSTALDYGALAAPAGKPAGALGGGGIRAYHGSPHDFDRFDLSKIGTGEGAQAYGHGLYFAEAEDVARSYRDILSTRIPDGLEEAGLPFEVHNAVRWYRNRGYGPDDIMADIQRNFPEHADTVAKALNVPKGRMYEVNINADPADFLDWDAPLSQQPQVLQDMARNADLSNLTGRQRRMLEHWRGEYTPPPGVVVDEPTGNILHSALTDYGTDPARNAAMTKSLADQGIPGIKYLDAGSRGAGDGSRNFVVFDDRLIEIVRKYGIAGAAAMLGISAAELQAQMGGASAAPSADDLRGYLLNVGAN